MNNEQSQQEQERGLHWNPQIPEIYDYILLARQTQDEAPLSNFFKKMVDAIKKGELLEHNQIDLVHNYLGVFKELLEAQRLIRMFIHHSQNLIESTKWLQSQIEILPYLSKLYHAGGLPQGETETVVKLAQSDLSSLKPKSPRS